MLCSQSEQIPFPSLRGGFTFASYAKIRVMQLIEGHFYQVPRTELIAIGDDYKIISCGGVMVKDWPDVGEARYCEEHGRMELLFWMTDHISYDVPPEAFSDVREVIQ